MTKRVSERGSEGGREGGRKRGCPLLYCSLLTFSCSPLSVFLSRVCNHFIECRYVYTVSTRKAYIK